MDTGRRVQMAELLDLIWCLVQGEGTFTQKITMFPVLYMGQFLENGAKQWFWNLRSIYIVRPSSG